MLETKNSASFQSLIQDRMKGFQEKSTETLDKMLYQKHKRKKRKEDRQFRMTCRSYFPEKLMQSVNKNVSVRERESLIEETSHRKDIHTLEEERPTLSSAISDIGKVGKRSSSFDNDYNKMAAKAENLSQFVPS